MAIIKFIDRQAIIFSNIFKLFRRLLPDVDHVTLIMRQHNNQLPYRPHMRQTYCWVDSNLLGSSEGQRDVG
jgi:hypothetical protein